VSKSSCQPAPAKPLLLAVVVVCATASIWFWFLFFSLYWPYRNLFNEEGVYFAEDGMVVHHEQSGVLIAPALGFLLLAAIFAVLWLFRQRPKD
jgi:hypothetical protein